MRCRFVGADTGNKPCPRQAEPGRTTCKRHNSAGRKLRKGEK